MSMSLYVRDNAQWPTGEDTGAPAPGGPPVGGPIAASPEDRDKSVTNKRET